jgi:chemotaxis methyl-accepting protein methylase
MQVFASDLHSRSLVKARAGFYRGDIEADVTPERLKRFFFKEEGAAIGCARRFASWWYLLHTI